MEGLPYIDEHSIRVAATRQELWRALASVLSTGFGGVAAPLLARLLGTVPAQLRGDWRGTLHRGDTLPGFSVAETNPPKRLALRGRHHFARYELVFELEANGAASSTLRALTWAEFRGIRGGAYRALVIGSGGHRLLTRRLLRDIARRA